MPLVNSSEMSAIQKDISEVKTADKNITNKKHSVLKPRNSKAGFGEMQKSEMELDDAEGAKVSTLISANLKKKNVDQTYVTQDDTISYSASNEIREPSRGDTKNSKSREKTSTAKRLPPGVRLYQQSKNPKNTKVQNKKDEGPPKPVLTKNVEEMLIQSNREKCEEVIKSSNEIHDTITKAGIDKNSMVDALFADPLFRHVLANLLFHAKILGKSKLEGFLHSRIKTFIAEYNTDRQIKENLNRIHSKIQEKIDSLKKHRNSFSKKFD